MHLRSEADPALNSIMSLSSGTDQRPRRPATTLIVVAITAIPNTYDNKAWRRAVLRIRLGREVSVRDLIGHPERECDVGEIAVVRSLLAVEVDATAAQLVEVRITKGEDRVDGKKRRATQTDAGAYFWARICEPGDIPPRVFPCP